MIISSKIVVKVVDNSENPAHKERWHHNHKEILETSYSFSVLKENLRRTEHVGKLFINGRLLMVVDSQVVNILLYGRFLSMLSWP